jgi:hypothetical protein
MAVELSKEGVQQEQFEQKLKLDERQVRLAENKLNAEIAAAKASGRNVSFDEVLAAQVMSGVISPAMEQALKLKRGGGEGDGEAGPFDGKLNPKEKQNPAFRYQ